MTARPGGFGRDFTSSAISRRRAAAMALPSMMRAFVTDQSQLQQHPYNNRLQSAKAKNNHNRRDIDAADGRDISAQGFIDGFRQLAKQVGEVLGRFVGSVDDLRRDQPADNDLYEDNENVNIND